MLVAATRCHPISSKRGSVHALGGGRASVNDASWLCDLPPSATPPPSPSPCRCAHSAHGGNGAFCPRPPPPTALLCVLSVSEHDGSAGVHCQPETPSTSRLCASKCRGRLRRAAGYLAQPPPPPFLLTTIEGCGAGDQYSVSDRAEEWAHTRGWRPFCVAGREGRERRLSRPRTSHSHAWRGRQPRRADVRVYHPQPDVPHGHPTHVGHPGHPSTLPTPLERRLPRQFFFSGGRCGGWRDGGGARVGRQ